MHAGGLGLDPADAVSNVRELRSHLRLLNEGADVADRLLSLLEEVGCAGKQMHDASVVATMLVRGVGAILTLNVRDFASFAGHVSVVPLRPP